MNREKRKQKLHHPFLERVLNIAGIVLVVKLAFLCSLFALLVAYDALNSYTVSTLLPVQYPNSELVDEFQRRANGSDTDFWWYCTQDSLEDVVQFYVVNPFRWFSKNY